MVEALGINFLEIAFAVINFIVLVAVLGKFLYRPFLNMLEERSQSIKGAFDNAEATNRRADEKLEAYNKRIANVEEEGREIIKSAKIKADNQGKEILEEASLKAQEMIKKAEKEIERQKAKVLVELKSQVASLVLMASEKVLERELEGEGYSELVDSIIEEAGETSWRN